ncbi:hypothetical protein LOTGIDRAFT_169754 [Lottia gigantea]|uniref:GON domain-containing protein n=1 Tax=Lottia gigantea TaxID=225164 RepID=V3YXX3_LOTGI|nr:hypothetical protein LOTGIDRAFT_169754 [Lottia gigantea]ESO82933.1 hypothetical protein LOTGIDRAFT_169754 [Lottia gigantea]
MERLIYNQAIDTCRDIKVCNSKYTTDGEYWMYPRILNFQRAKLYCKDMNSHNPKEYLTLNEENYAEYPNGSSLGHGECKVDSNNMVVVQTDYGFTHQEYGNPVPYGKAIGCSFLHNVTKCQVHGSVEMNISLTGLIFDSSTNWVWFGHQAYIVKTKRTDHEIFIVGDGGCGGGKPNGQIKLLIDKSYTPPLASATEPKCV